ncbi:hypothetical protein [Clostridium disporicum]|uniref:hypothetical protein n=1 Tax=Clostridium disporicum TaxID=84024 RepID=UPI0036175B1D
MFILDMIKADKYNSRADSINIKSFNKLAKTQELQREQQIKTSQSIIKLANRKKGIISTSINDFINLYERIMKINFIETDGIREVYKLNNSVGVIDEMKIMISTVSQVLTEKDTVNTFLVGFLKFGGLTGGVSNVIEKEAELNENAARMRKKQINVIESQIKTINTSLEAIYERAERISIILAKINILFRKSIEVTSKIIDKNGADRFKYSKEEKEYIRNCMNFADAVKKILDTPLFDANGELTIQSKEAIIAGEEFLNRINSIIDN